MTADHAAIRARLDAITPGQWVSRGTRLNGVVNAIPGPCVVGSCAPVDAEFIAHAPEDMRALLADYDEKSAQVDQLNEWLDEENAKNDTYRAEITRLLAVIEAAPHDLGCNKTDSPWSACTCWKSRAWSDAQESL